jgi:hypothetical protein
LVEGVVSSGKFERERCSEAKVGIAGGSKALERDTGTCRSVKKLKAAGQVWALQGFIQHLVPRLPQWCFFLVVGSCWDMRMVCVEKYLENK